MQLQLHMKLQQQVILQKFILTITSEITIQVKLQEVINTITNTQDITRTCNIVNDL